MGRSKIDLTQFGITIDADTFIDSIVDSFNDMVRGQHTVDELLLHPREAINFCNTVRRKHHYPDVPDDVILRFLMRRRKSPQG